MDPNKIKILVVEDNPGYILLISEHLKETGLKHELEFCKMMKDVKKRLDQFKPNLVISGLNLPDSPCDDTIDEIQHISTTYPVIALTELSDDEIGERAIRRGAQDYLIKAEINAPSLRKSIKFAIERYKIFRALNQSRTNYRTLIDSVPDLMYIICPEGKIADCNQSAIEFTGYTRNELIGKQVEDIYDEGSREMAVTFFQEWKKSGILRNKELKIRTKKGQAIDVELNVNTVRDESGAITSSVSVQRVITERKKVEAMRNKLAHADRLLVIGQLAAGVAHEINNPAAYIMANISSMQATISEIKDICSRVKDCLEFDDLDTLRDKLREVLSASNIYPILAESEEILKETFDGVDRIRSIVKDLRIFSRLEEDKLEFTSINEVIDIACNMTYNEIKHKARLEKNLSKLPLIKADKGKLVQVIINMMLNSAQAIVQGDMDNNKIRIISESKDDKITVRIEDTGKGIPPEARDHIFEPFFTTKPKEKGTGLGLALCADIINKHKGEIRLLDTSSEGTRFEIKIPFDPKDAVKGPLTQQDYAKLRSGNKKRLLLIDDEALLLKAYKRNLQDDYQISTCERAEEALELLKKDQDFHLILCDIIMPGMSGIDLFNEIREKMPELSKKFVFCSGSGFGFSSKEIKDTYDNIFLQKPISMAKLKETIADFLNDKD